MITLPPFPVKPSASPPSPALSTLLQALNSDPGFLDFLEVRISRSVSGYRIQHLRDAAPSPVTLQRLELPDLRSWAQKQSNGNFRPLKSAPTLRSGWYWTSSDPGELESAVDALYPGALVDWHAGQGSDPGIQHFRQFMRRQSGAYRRVIELSDDDAAAVGRASCAKEFCLRERRWTVEGLPAETASAGKGMVPCLEPCPLLLEFARSVQMTQAEPTLPLDVRSAELQILLAILDRTLSEPVPGVREGDFSTPTNPRRIRLLRDRLEGLMQELPPSGPVE